MSNAEAPKRTRGRPPAGARAAILVSALQLIEETGLATLTTRKVAERAAVSEASVFYHYGDKLGLLQAAIGAGLEPLKALRAGDHGAHAGKSLVAWLQDYADALESFFDRSLPVLEALHADTALRADFAERMVAEDLGPHRGVRFVHEQLTSMIGLGMVRADADTMAAGTMLVGACFLRSWTNHLMGRQADRNPPSLQPTVQALADLLRPQH